MANILQRLAINNSNLIQVLNVIDMSRNEVINDAQVFMTLKDINGDDVGGVTWPISLGYVSGTDGMYSGILPPYIELFEGAEYSLIVDIFSSNNGAGEKVIPCLAVVRST
jgi:hypothetical protein